MKPTWTTEQLIRYQVCANGDLGPECCEEWARTLSDFVSNASEIVDLLRTIQVHGLSSNCGLMEEIELGERLDLVIKLFPVESSPC
jgi:hypothetical protein